MSAASCHSSTCDFLSSLWLSIRGYSIPRQADSIESVLDQLANRQIQLELQDRRCVAEARRCRAGANRGMFRSKMLEHRRLQAQLMQLQRYRESALAHMDAVSNHEINKSFMRAIRSTASLSDAGDRKEAEEAMEGLNESISQVKDLSELLGQSVQLEDVTDEDLEQEFAEFTAGCGEEEDAAAVVMRKHPGRVPESMAAAAVEEPRTTVGLRVPLLLGS